MKKLLLAALVSQAFAASAFAACADADITPDVFNSIQANDSLGSLQARLPCGLPTPTTYTDAIGRQFQVYTWSTLNKSMTIQTYENRVFTKTGSGLGFQATKAAPPPASFDANSNVLSVPILTLTDDQGSQTTYYDAKIAMNENGNWAILSMDNQQRGDVAYDTRGYAPANYDLKTGALTVPTLADDKGQTVAFQAILKSDGTWKDASGSDTLNVIAQNQLPLVPPDNPHFDDASRVMTLPILQMTDASGNVQTYYDAKLALTENGGWSLLSKNTTPPSSVRYDLKDYAPANLDMTTGVLMVPQLVTPKNATPMPFRANLSADGTWTDQSDILGLVSHIAPTVVEPALASYSPQAEVLTLPVVTVKDANGQTTTYYDAKISLSENGNWTILSMDSVKKNNEVYDVKGYQAAKLDLSTGELVVPMLSDNQGTTTSFRAVLANNGTWKDVSSPSQPKVVGNSYESALVAKEQYMPPTPSYRWPGLNEGGIIVVQGVAYRNTQAGCAVPSALDSVTTISSPGSAQQQEVQMIADAPNINIYRRGANLYVTVDGWAGGCQVSDLGTAPQ